MLPKMAPHHHQHDMTRRGGGGGGSLTGVEKEPRALNPALAGRGCEASVQIRQPYGIVGTAVAI